MIMPTLQMLVVTLIVVLSFAYASWALMPAAWRRRLAVRALGLPGLRRNMTLQRAARGANSCGCDGCDGVPAAASGSGQAQTIKIVRRAPP